MNFFDRILLILASFCLASIFIIFFSGELSSNHSPGSYENKDDLPERKMIVYSEEIDHVIKEYFRTLKNNPEIDEEEKRLVNDVFPEIEKQSKKNHSTNSDTKNVKKTKKLIVVHKVQTGESLWRISNQYNVPLYTIISANPHKANQLIHPGDKLKIPTQKGIIYRIKKRDNLSLISRKYKTSIREIKKVNRMKSSVVHPGDQIFLPGAKPLPRIQYRYKNRFIWPIRGKITSGYGWRKHPVSKKKHFHQGIDIGARKGTKIRAITKGVVIHSGKSGGYGRLVILRHSQGYLSAYAHCSKIYVKKGDVVNQGKIIARVGNSGLVTGSHLHFEIKRYAKNLSPIYALKKKLKVPVT